MVFVNGGGAGVGEQRSRGGEKSSLKLARRYPGIAVDGFRAEQDGARRLSQRCEFVLGTCIASCVLNVRGEVAGHQHRSYVEMSRILGLRTAR